MFLHTIAVDIGLVPVRESWSCVCECVCADKLGCLHEATLETVAVCDSKKGGKRK